MVEGFKYQTEEFDFARRVLEVLLVEKWHKLRSIFIMPSESLACISVSCNYLLLSPP